MNETNTRHWYTDPKQPNLETYEVTFRSGQKLLVRTPTKVKGREVINWMFGRENIADVCFIIPNVMKMYEETTYLEFTVNI